MTIEFQYDPHSQLYDLINTGIELDLILSDDNEAASEERMQRVRERVDNDNKEIHDLHKQQKDLEKGVFNMMDKIKEKAENGNYSDQRAQALDVMGSLAKEKEKMSKMKEIMDRGKKFKDTKKDIKKGESFQDLIKKKALEA